MGPNPTLVEIMKTEEVPNLNWQAIVVEKGHLDHMKEEVMTMKMKMKSFSPIKSFPLELLVTTVCRFPNENLSIERVKQE